MDHCYVEMSCIRLLSGANLLKLHSLVNLSTVNMQDNNHVYFNYLRLTLETDLC